MHVLIIGAAGMLGRKLAHALAGAVRLGGQRVTRLTLADVVPPPLPGGITATAEAVDLRRAGVAAALVATRPDVIFHLAAVVSAQAEAEFETGYAVNLDATRALMDAIRAQPDYCPRLVFTSSIAVFGTPFPARIPDAFPTRPKSSYGTQKAMVELLLDDLTRRGHVDAISLRLPTICIRPDAPNRAASGFFSNILREPLMGKPAVLPVRDSLRHWFASPRAAVRFLMEGAVIEGAALGHDRALTLPGLSATVAEAIEALRRVAGQKAVDLIHHAPDPAIAAIVETWPQDFEAARARALGFTAEASFDEIIAAHIEDEMGGRLP
ncbi:MAG: NAD-dependent epimerase/dehydratase family protein [Limimaricola sp.]|uniref:D-erythronate dehydrogenase n=1 Tax=Limimaricola sp. TaxID=2211665 RepID=UPI001DBA92AD|nr:D-erythronate dehydrogenase [Limimaricola sp.]MBI1417435.1 NAD-dependent epimerase/dehydratase family protein [Limimaricola sp.]